VHGLIFSAFREFTAGELPDAHEAVWSGAPTYHFDEAYSDEDFRARLERASTAAGLSLRDLLLGFGSFTSRVVFLGMRPEFFAESRNTRQFLLDVESRIHRTLRTAIPGVAPPRLHVVPFGSGGVSITYTSDRELCDLLEGLVVGTAAHYGERFEIEHPICMKRGDEACAFFVTPMA
jgi:hypothetical protein